LSLCLFACLNVMFVMVKFCYGLLDISGPPYLGYNEGVLWAPMSLILLPGWW
jgi:hypothetical protein